MVAYAYKPSSQEKRELKGQSQPGLHSKNLFKKERKKGIQEKRKRRVMGRKEEYKAANNNHGDRYEELPCFSVLYRFSMIIVCSSGGVTFIKKVFFKTVDFYLTQQ